ncbi:MAG: hypothetical protein ACC645_21425, partial [Pirellulales bacterium]
GIALLGRQSLLVQDEFALHTTGQAWWFVNTRAEVTVAEDGRSAILDQGGVRLTVHMIEPIAARFQVMPSQPFDSSPNPPNQNPNQGVRKLAIHLEGVDSGRIVVQMIPQTEDAELSVMGKTGVLPLSQW